MTASSGRRIPGDMVDLAMGEAGTTTEQPLFPYGRWEAEVDKLAERYRSAEPFPHVVRDNFLDDEVVSGR